MDYNKTLNLPETEYPMRGNLPTKEPAMIQKWDDDELYKKILKKNEGRPSYVLHDGPPYANGDIHLGTALNKILKDIIVKQKNMSGYRANYVPGWDTHGLPIELKAMKAIGVENGAIPPLELRKHCREFALSYVESQKQQFKRLGVLGDFENPYLTLKPDFEARQIEVFGEMAKKGYIYKGLKPVYWCPECHYGKIDILFNNAGTWRGDDAEKVTTEDWKEVIDVNLTGPFIVSREVGKVMLAQKKGSIVNIASMSGMIVNTPQNQCAYNASKGGLIMLTKSMATEWADRGVRVNAICPGYMRTEMSEDRYQRKDPAIERWFSMTPMGRSGVPDELMGVAVYLASDASSYTTGSTYLVDGGYTAW